MPPLSFEIVFSIRIPRVSAFLPDVTQQIHSLRAKGVISFHVDDAFGETSIALRKSIGKLCTVPFFFIYLFYSNGICCNER